MQDVTALTLDSFFWLPTAEILLQSGVAEEIFRGNLFNRFGRHCLV
jgi:hypothetical protein